MRWVGGKQEMAEANGADETRPDPPRVLVAGLARLVVDALEVGTGKGERDVIDELFEAFDLDFAELDRQVPPQTKDRANVLRARAADELARAAPGAAQLLQEILRRGSRFVAMLDEVYARLAKHDATTLVAAEVFRLGRDEIPVDLTISKAFLEQVRELQHELERIAIGAIDEAALRTFINMDNGGCYGRWPLGDYNNGFPLADAVHHLGWISARVSADSDIATASLRASLAEANSAADRMCSTAEGLLRSHLLHLDWLEQLTENGEHLSDDDFHRRLFSSAPDHSNAVADVEAYRLRHVLGISQYTGSVSDLSDMTFLGVDADLQYTSFPSDEWQGGSGLAVLATFLAMRRIGAYYMPNRQHLEAALFDSPAHLAGWLHAVRTNCDAATLWLSEDVVTRSGTLTLENEVERIREFLNLPMWRARDLLYEVWVLCATLTACEESGWDAELRELDGDVWRLTVGATHRPVAALTNNRDGLSLDVWREPHRIDRKGGILTPDVTISTKAPLVRDLVVVEAKDRIKMSPGSNPMGTESAAGTRSAVAVALRYSTGLGPSITWVCNHCDYREPVDPGDNHGDPWSRVHVAGPFRPGVIPPEFATSIGAAISPPAAAMMAETRAGLLLVVDWTSSFVGRRTSALNRVALSSIDRGRPVRAVIFSDHGDDEPFLVRKLGPAQSVAEILEAADSLPPGNGGDVPEALEDALARCREIVADVGPQDVVILTDAPPHDASACPYGIDYREEIQRLVEAGCRVFIADDWNAGVKREDLTGHLPRELLDRVIREPLETILVLAAERAAGTASHS